MWLKLWPQLEKQVKGGRKKVQNVLAVNEMANRVISELDEHSEWRRRRESQKERCQR